MRKFIYKILFFILFPIISIGLIEFVLPINFFTNRNWEALMNKSSIPHFGSFYPNKNVKSIEYGDLGHHTEFQIAKKVTWNTDDLGFRNDSIPKKIDILLIGDSFFAGTSLTQKDIFNSKLIEKFKYKKSIYNLAPSNLSYGLELIENKVISKPKIIIFSIVERNIPENFNINKDNISLKYKIKYSIKKSNVSEYSDRFFRYHSFNWLSSRITNVRGKGIKSPMKNDFLFLTSGQVKEKTKKQIDEIANTILSYKQKCEELGIKFVFLPMPNKETVYYKYLKLKNQPNYLFKLNQKLDSLKVDNINVLSCYNSANKNILYYHLDDTHWNSNGINLISKVTYDFLNKMK